MDTTRYTTILCSENLILQADCPVHAKKLQCTKDTLTGSLFLQVRYVNRCERTVESLVIRVSVLEGGKEVAAIRALPISGLSGKPHQCFGDEKTVVLPRCGDEIRVIIEQVGFTDGYLWRSKSSSSAIVIEEPVRICGKVQPCRKSGYWYCSCSMVNPDSRSQCDYCGTAAPELPKKAEPEKVAISDSTDLSTPQQAEAASSEEPKLTLAQMVTLLNALPTQAPAPLPERVIDADEEFPQIESKKKKSHKGLWVALIIALLLAIGACIYFGFPYPYIKYYQARQLKNEGKYSDAISAFEKLEDYSDSADQVKKCMYLQALDSYNNGQYEDALEQAMVLDSEEGNQLVLNCLYMLSSLSLTENADFKTANLYLEQARSYIPIGAQEPDWIRDVRQQSLYLEAMDAYNRADYAAAASLFEESGYGNSNEWVDLCRYQLAADYYSSGEYELAVEAFTALGDFQDSLEMADRSMYAYVEENLNPDDPLTEQYLLTLIDHDFDGAQETFDTLYAWAVEFSRDGTGALKDVSELVFRYDITSGPHDGSVLAITMEYTLPNAQTATVSLASKLLCGDSGTVKWSDLLTVKDNTKGTLKLRFLNAATNDVLGTLNVVVSG